MRTCSILLLTLLLIRAREAYGQKTELLFHRISLEQGLSDARVSSIVQDRYGFLWFGTANGLNRYDGYNIRVYEAGKSGLRNSAITSLLCSRAGALYLSDGNGLLEYNYTTDRFERPEGSDSSDLNRKSFTVTLMAEDTAGRIYIGCTQGFFRYSPGKALMEDMNRLLGTGGAITYISGLTFGPDGRLWVTTQKQGFFIVSPAAGTYTEVPHDRQYGHDSCCYAIHRTVFLDDDHLLVGQHSFGLTVLDTRTLKFTAQQGMMGKNDAVRFNAVYRLIKDYKGRIWGGTAYFGLIQYMPRTKEIIRYKYDPFNPYSYGGYRVTALYEDREHNIWVGTGGYGIYRFHPDKAYVRYYPWYPMGQQSPPGPEVLSAAVRDTASVWVGTDKGPAIFYIRKGIFKAYRYESSYSISRPGSNINFIYRDRAGTVWMASRFLGMSRFQEHTQQFMRFYKKEDHLIKRQPKKEQSEIPDNLIKSIAEDPEGRLLLLINNRIAIFDTGTLRSRYGTTDSSDELLRLENISDMLRSGSRLLLATQSNKGTRLLDYSFITKQSRLIAAIDTSGKARINRLQALPDSSIAAATGDGIYIIGKDGGLMRHYTPNAGGTHNMLGLITGIPGVIWVSTDRQVGRVELRTGEWLWLGSSEGLKPTRFFGDAFKLLPDGRIIAGSGDGLFLIDPSSLTRGRPQVPVLVDFKVSGRPFPLPVPLQEVQEIRLTYEQNFFSFGISTLHFGESSNTEYSYKLEGFDKEWQPAGASRTGQYTGVPGGSYTLLLRARTGTAAWVMAPQKVHLIISRPWWVTWAFRIAMLLLLLLLITAIYLYRVRTIRRDARLRSDYEIRLNELEMSALRTQMNPHFIFNCLNTINSFINSNQKTEANQYITRFARLIRLILENSRKRRIPLSSELDALVLYMQLEQLRFGNRFDYNISIAPELDTDNVEVPPLVLQPFVENAILHGILPKTGNGHITITITASGNMIRYLIEDDGVGRVAARLRDQDSVLKKESHGMGITIKRIGLFNKENNLAAGVQVIDLMDGERPAGTRVEIPLALVEGF